MLHTESEESEDSEERLKKEKEFLEKISVPSDIDKTYLKLFRHHLPMVQYFIQQGVNINEFALVDINVLKTCFYFSTDAIQKILIYITPAQLFSLKSETIYLCLYYINQLKILFQHGCKFENIESLQYFNLNFLKKILANRNLDNILKFVSIKQMLNIDMTPIPLENILKYYPDYPDTLLNTTINHSGKGKNGDFYFEYTEHSIRITDQKENYFNLTLDKYDESMPVSLKQKMTAKNTQFFKFIHTWFVMEEEIENELQIRKFIIFSPDLHYLMHEVYSLSFTKEKLQENLSLIMHIPFYAEKDFHSFLQKEGCPINIFRSLPGMTKTKLILLCEHQDIIADLIKYQINIIDFANIQEDRLRCILKNYDAAQYALSLVSARVLFGLPAPSQTAHSSSFFRAINVQEEKESKKVERNTTKCVIS